MQILTITECQPLYLHLNHTYFMICLWTSRLPFAKFTATKAISAITTKGSICHHVPCSISFLLFFFFNEGDNQCIKLLCFAKVHFQRLTAQRNIHFITTSGMKPLQCFGLNGHQEFFKQGMFMLSIKGWAVIKTHFYLNECKLAHLLWWASCPDSSISMIDQLSSCWWLTGNGIWGTDGAE